jgi:hypothetical protein
MYTQTRQNSSHTSNSHSSSSPNLLTSKPVLTTSTNKSTANLYSNNNNDFSHSKDALKDASFTSSNRDSGISWEFDEQSDQERIMDESLRIQDISMVEDGLENLIK